MCCEAPPVSSSHRLSRSCALCARAGEWSIGEFHGTAHRGAARVPLSFGIMHSTRVMDWEEVHRQPPPDRR